VFSVLCRKFEQRIEERALFDLGEKERKGEMRVRETERKRPERIGEENAHDDRSLWNSPVTA
jgi:hypothetical protein